MPAACIQLDNYDLFEKAQLKPSPLRYSWEILLPSLGLIKHVHDVINLLYYKHWTGKWKYIPYISVTHKVLKSCRSKTVTLAHDVCDMRRASSLYIKTFWQILYRIFLLTGWGSPPTNQKFVHSVPLHRIFIPSHQNSIQPNSKIKTSLLAVVIAPVPYLF